jgi:class 3 adenylate cyclase/alpha-beta hydrolase superfamily lysophospholipase
VKPRTRYARDGDVCIAYQVFGDGPAELLHIWGPATHIEHMWDEPHVARFYDRLGTFARVLLLDRRGTGASDPTPGPPTLEQQMKDLETVIEAAGFDRPYLFGESNASHVCALYAASFPDRVAGLIMYSSYAVGAEVLTPPLTELLKDLIENAWGEGGTILIFAPSVADDPVALEWFGRAERLAAPPGIVRQLVEMEAQVDIRPVLPSIRVPTLVLHRREDPMVDFELGRQVAQAIPGARFVPLEGGDNFSFFGDSQALLDEVERFVTGTRHHHESYRVLTTLMFTDIVGSTERAAELGDQRWRDLLDDHYRRIRQEVDRFGGREIRTLGDGFLATFDGPARAIRCGCEIATDVHRSGIATRVGVHTGEVERLDGDLAGLAVHIGARVAAEACSGEVLVSGTVKDLVVGSGIEFADRGERELKGVPGTWRLYAVQP